ncbi:MAG: hypothetical protein ACK2TS_07855 [Anaerolineales bacterium]|jgi:hypothetical protein
MDKIQEIVTKAQKDPAFSKELKANFDEAIILYRLTKEEKEKVKNELGKVGIIFY